MLQNFSKFLLSLTLTGFCHADLTLEQRIEDYQTFWENTRDTYIFHEWKHKDHGVAWEAVREQMLPRVESSTTDLELYQAIAESQAMLRDGHCYNNLVDVFLQSNPLFYIPVQFEVVNGRRFAVSRIREGLDATNAGLEVGDEVVRVDGQSIRQFTRKHRHLIAASSPGQFYAQLPQWLHLHHPMLGAPDQDSRRLTLRKPDGATYEIEIPFQIIEPRGPKAAVSSFAEDGHVSLSQAEQQKLEGPLPIETRIFEETNIGYLSISSFMKVEDSETQIAEAFTSLQGTDGLLLDLRGNGGGVLKWGILMSNYLIPHTPDNGPNLSPLTRIIHPTVLKHTFSTVESSAIDQLFHDPVELSKIVNRFFGSGFEASGLKTDESGFVLPFPATSTVNEAENQIDVYQEPIYVLMNGGCYSTTDMLITLLDAYDRATFVGTPNGAGGGSPTAFELPHSGIQIHLSTGLFTTPQGTRIEGRPVQPDIRATPSAEDIRNNVDTVLNVAAKALFQELNPSLSGYGSEQFEAGVSTVHFQSGQSFVPEFGEIVTPDWILPSMVETNSLH